MSRIVEKSDFNKYANDFVNELKYGDRYDPVYGVEFVEITEQQLEHLKKGNVLYFDVLCEYCVLLRMKDEK